MIIQLFTIFVSLAVFVLEIDCLSNYLTYVLITFKNIIKVELRVACDILNK